jgi:hypothetical protein
VVALVKLRLLPLVLLLLLLQLLAPFLLGQVPFRVLDRDVIEARLSGFSYKNPERESILEDMFKQSGCAGDKLQKQVVRKRIPPNLICVVPGETDRVILVGAHSDHVVAGDGVADNWSGASLLPSLMYSLTATPRKHTLVFVAFTDEESGMSGSIFYAKQLTAEQRSKIDAMVNIDTLGLGPTKIWATHADAGLVNLLSRVADSMKLPLGVVNVDNVGSTDSESFAQYKIPRITVHSITQETWNILHSHDDTLKAIKMDDYFTSYRLLIAYLAVLDVQPPRLADETGSTSHH